MKKIVLAHGILGFGSSGSWLGVTYFNGVVKALREQGYDVFSPAVDPVGSLSTRSQQLETAIEEHWPDESDVAVIAHSMGGLDARRVINRAGRVGRRIKSLITIGTPHWGSPVADAIVKPGNKLRQYIPPHIFRALNLTPALGDLVTRDSTSECLQDCDRDWVTYREVVCVCNTLGQKKSSALFSLAQAIGGISGTPNDGVVTRASACCSGRPPFEVWETDHGGAIGWPTDSVSDWFGFSTLRAAFSPPAEHLQRYLRLAAVL